MTDALLDIEGDLRIENNDVVIGESTSQHQMLLIATEKSAWKESPMVGVGAFHYIENEDAAGLLNEIRRQFTNDGQTVTRIFFDTTGKLKIDAFYNS